MANKRLYLTIADKITQLIDDGAFPPGSRLPGERELAERFKVSRVTIREAEIALQAVGRIQIKTGSGVYVLDAEERPDGGLPEVTAFELTEARSLFESEAAALAARVIDDKTLSRLEGLIEQMSSDQDDEASRRADLDFHFTIAASSGNAAVRYIIEILWKMRNELEPVRKVYESICSAEDSSARGAEHAEILHALRDRDPNAARTAMRKHFRRLLESMLDVTEEQALQEIRTKHLESRARFLTSASL